MMEEYLKTRDIPININPLERRDSIIRSPPGPSEMSVYPAMNTEAETSEKETKSENELLECSQFLTHRSRTYWNSGLSVKEQTAHLYKNEKVHTEME
ncbi:hypothetical protein JTB14_030587 [Gonioctena quinquepunctata]|nr:hypothetical protein JTB14_030587 [Gonioctena quinquepunctata]